MTDTTIARGIGDNLPPEPIDPFPPIKKRVDELAANANRWANERPEIADADQATAAKDFLDQLAAELKVTEADRKKLNAPHDLAITQNNDRFRPLKSLLEACVGVLRLKLTARNTKLQAELDRVAREKEKAALEAKREADRLAEEAARAAATGKGDVVGLAVAAQEADRAATQAFKASDRAAVAKPIVKGSFGGRSTSNRTTWHFRIVDPALVPKEYLIPDELKIGAAVRRKLDGSQGPPLRTLPGVEIYPETKAV